MSAHECAYAETIGQPIVWIKDSETGAEVCQWCHEPKYQKVASKRATKNVRK